MSAGSRRLGGPGGIGVGQLQVGRDLLEVAENVLARSALEHRQQRTKRLDRQLGLLEVAVLLRELAVAERRERVKRLDEEIRDLELLQLLLEPLDELLVGRLLRLRHFGGSHSSNRCPSGSTAQAKRPYSCSSTWSSTSTPAPRSCASIASRSRTRKLTMSCCSGAPK